jgi:hypothetical protein
MIEPINFTKGINTRKTPLYLEDGELVSCSGFSFNSEGVMEAMSPKEAVNTTSIGSIHTIHRYLNYIVAADGANVRYKWDLDCFCDLYTPPDTNFTLAGTLGNSNRLSVTDYDDFVFFVNGLDRKVFCKGNVYDWEIENPVSPPSGTATAGGSLSGTYTLYYTYLIMFPNGRIVETGPSPAGSCAVSSQKITWNVPKCSYSGTDLVIHRRLYRTSTALIDIYYSATISNNTDTTYVDNNTDATLQANWIIDTADYYPIPKGISNICTYIFRTFGIVGNTLVSSEPYLPFNFDPANTIEISKAGEDLVVAVPWGDQLYIANEFYWWRLQGYDPTTWALRGTFAKRGVINAHTVKASRYGIIGQGYDGIYLFDGTVSKNITLKQIGTKLFTDISNAPATSLVPRRSTACFAEFDDFKYYFYYPSTGVVCDKCLVIDFAFYPTLRMYHGVVMNAHEYSGTVGVNYYAKTDGYQYKDGTTGTTTFSLQTGDRLTAEHYRQKQATHLFYDINTGGKDVVVTIYVDGTAKSPTLTFNTSSRTKGRRDLGNFQGYRFSVAISCSDSQGVSIYEPWGLALNPFGD